MRATIGVWSPTLLGVKLHTVPASLLVSLMYCHCKQQALNQFAEGLLSLCPVPEVCDLDSELHGVVDWMKLGLHLGIKMTRLNTIKADCSTLGERRIQLFNAWQKEVIPTWSAMVQALNEIGERRLASKLARKHGQLNNDSSHK